MPSNLILPDSRSFSNSSIVRQVLTSYDAVSSQVRSEAEDFISRTITENSESTGTGGISNDAFRMVIWFLAAIDESVLTARVVNQQRDMLEKAAGKEDPEELEVYCRKIGLDVGYDVEEEIFSVDLEDFLHYTRRVSGARYRLIYQAVRGGRVYSLQDTVAKLIRERFVALTFGIVDSIDSRKARDVLGENAEFADSMKKLYREYHEKRRVELGEINFNLFPPCIKEYLKELGDGINLPHIARLALASFLHKVGMESEKIMELFRTAPDFDPRTTEYQVKHIAGEISGVEYSPPKCATLQANHICYKGDDTLCAQEWLRHPLWYYEVKKRKKN